MDSAEPEHRAIPTSPMEAMSASPVEAMIISPVCGGFFPEERTGVGPSEGNKQTPKKRKFPTIFYATRTHSQITQVIREYRKTSYRVPMAVLAARKHYCTNKQVCKKKNIDEECKLLLKDSERSCFQFKNVHKVKSHYSLQKGGVHEIHDIEDLVGIGNSVRGCAYFAARSLALDAEIVFCPYGYLLNPVIRNAMEINLDGSIVILDEAHNIEDVAREAGSIDVETSNLEGLRMELEQLGAMGAAADFYHPLLDMVQEMLSWLYQKSTTLEKQDFERYSSCWSGEGAVQELERAGIQYQSFGMLSECAKKAVGAAAEAETDGSHLSGFAAGTLEGLFSVLNFMLKDNGVHLHDYRLVVQKYVKRDAELGVTGWVSSFSLWCLNPAVVFGEIASKAQSIILTSGTLSPIGSFASELGVTFEVSMEAPHVIDMKTQVWAGVLPRGLGNVPLNASYKHADGYAFQDALGKTLEELFKATPDGALVFFPSYKLLDKLCDRWKATGQWNQLYELKQLFIEPRGQMETFETMLADYYRVVSGKSKIAVQKGKPREGGKRIAKDHHTETFMKRKSKSGAAFLAVCRGKVSEGIDFSDKNARIVIVVGIPFPNQKDMQVNMKKQYNNKNKNLLSGDQWYCYQAFRALNQAVGRCIRHRHDYGAIILVDERYKRASNLEYMSKWLRNSIQQLDTLEDSLKGLHSFFQKFQGMPSPVPSLNMTITKDLERDRGSSSQKITKSGPAPAKQSQRNSLADGKENAVCLSNRTVVTAMEKTRPPKNKQSGGFLVANEDQGALEGNDHTQGRMMDKRSIRVECDEAPVLKQIRSPLQEIQAQAKECMNDGLTHSVSVITIAESPTAACSSPQCWRNDHTQRRTMDRQSNRVQHDGALALKQGHSPLQEIQGQARADIDDGFAQAVSVITIAESPTITAACSSPRCERTGISFDNSSAQKCVKATEEHWTPSVSTVHSRSEVYASISSHSRETLISKDKHRPVTPCNLFKENNENTSVLSAKSLKNLPSTDVCIRSLTTDFTVCNNMSLNNGGKCDFFKANDGLSASKEILEESTTRTHGSVIQSSILCLKCGTSLSGALAYGHWQKESLKKKYLNGLNNTGRKFQQAEYTDVLVLELPLLHPLIQEDTCNTSYFNQPSGSVWVKEDGCVFKPLFCVGCNFKQCIGAYVQAADRTNMKLVEKALVFCDAVEFTGEEGGCMGGTQWYEDLPTEGRCQEQQLNSFAKRMHQTQTPPRLKLKLPRRD
ncbi:hypothetical protein GOP47_0017726 [Adiantum capillus-veneris]|uniref:DNA 5'-3' helicase FANCJ n=1 Tax=Adiantum capillus-veneris TaxID=13818 RepID=A0A9D4UFX1_ADICA|nr:hypothetical protein GOP47_0017726 [Adiantum capillus-veneris]